MENATQRSPHGTASRYNNQGCRCHRCRAAWADYCRDRAHALGRKPRNFAYYSGRVERPIALRPTDIGMRMLEAAEVRTGYDRHDIIERLLRKGAATVTFDDATSTDGLTSTM